MTQLTRTCSTKTITPQTGTQWEAPTLPSPGAEALSIWNFSLHAFITDCQKREDGWKDRFDDAWLLPKIASSLPFYPCARKVSQGNLMSFPPSPENN